MRNFKSKKKGARKRQKRGGVIYEKNTEEQSSELSRRLVLPCWPEYKYSILYIASNYSMHYDKQLQSEVYKNCILCKLA